MGDGQRERGRPLQRTRQVLRLSERSHVDPRCAGCRGRSRFSWFRRRCRPPVPPRRSFLFFPFVFPVECKRCREGSSGPEVTSRPLPNRRTEPPLPILLVGVPSVSDGETRGGVHRVSGVDRTLHGPDGDPHPYGWCDGPSLQDESTPGLGGRGWSRWNRTRGK